MSKRSGRSSRGIGKVVSHVLSSATPQSVTELTEAFRRRYSRKKSRYRVACW
ncbi:MAG: hypothetical protein IPL89_07090 [Acidobacteria bacterium]|nr:hypothetical protein [Acidobacteriota bacterium]